MKYFTLLLSIFVASLTLAQTIDKRTSGRVQGFVFDEKTKDPIPSASVRILSKDSLYIKGTASNDKGKFNVSLPSGSFIIEISYLGYNKYLKNFDISPSKPLVDLDSIYLHESAYLLNAAVVEAKVPDIRVKGDTIEYNSAAYSSQESDMLQDLVQNIPGIEIDGEGNITANGKSVTKILVDGKEFFGNDIPLALKNLPANMIKTLQLYKEASEESKITGFKDKDPQQVINLVVKEELKQSVFGDIKAGYGTDDKYANKATINYMRNENQISFIGEMNNVDDSGYSSGGDNGIDKNKRAGISAQIKSSDKLKWGGSLRYSENDNQITTISNTLQFIENKDNPLQPNDRHSKQEMWSSNKRRNENISLNLEWKPDSLTTIYARSYISFNNSNSSNNSENLSYVVQKDTTTSRTESRTKGNGYNVNSYFNIGRKLNSKGRTLSLALNTSLRKDDSEGSNYSRTMYTGGTPEKIIDQKSRTESQTNNYNLSLSYVEPLGKDYKIQLSYSINNGKSNRDRNVYKIDGNENFSIIDTAYTRETNNKSVNQNIALNFQATKGKYEYTIGFNISPSYSRSKVSFRDSIIENIRQNVVNYSPRLDFTYNPNDNSSFNFNYSGNTNQPSISQRSGDTTIVSAMSKYYGNPDLKPSFNNQFSTYYQKSDYESGRFLFISGSFNYTFQNIVNYTTIDNLGNSLNTYRNVDGNMGANLNISYNTPLKNKKFSINNNSYVSYYKNIGFSNGDKSVTNNVVLGENITGKFKSNKFETSLSASISYNMARNSLSENQDRNTTAYGLRNTILWKLPLDFSIQSKINFTYYSGYGDDFKKSEILWNASIEKKLLKKKKGSLKLQFFDILNDRNNIQRYVSGNYISDSRSNTVNKYVMLSFSYQFNIIMSKGKANQDTNDMYYDDF